MCSGTIGERARTSILGKRSDDINKCDCNTATTPMARARISQLEEQFEILSRKLTKKKLVAAALRSQSLKRRQTTLQSKR
jgi:hypothetical protein